MGVTSVRIIKKVAPVIVGILLVITLYWLLKTALPKYSGRTPFLLLLFLIDWMMFRSIRVLWRKFPKALRYTLNILWWTPLTVLVLFLFFVAIVPMQDIGRFWQIFLPGFPLMVFLAKTVMVIPLLPDFFLQIKAFVSGLISGNRTCKQGIFFLSEWEYLLVAWRLPAC